MNIKQIISQCRRDFTAIYECEHCGHTEKAGGYDDAHFHLEVIPKMSCSKCSKSAGENYQPQATKYPEDFQV
ncbi:MAG: hypothetical protein M0Q93_00050 [Terrimicrobiaceae bacterium]|jgi:hypothetical protein|nr:hypothetical protein [Terrimicrobiaceae bacterium]